MHVLVTGSSGFLGSHVVEELGKNPNILVFGNGTTKRKYDLRDEEQTRALFNDTKPDIVVHCAGLQGGIGFNKSNPVQLFIDNTQMALNVTKLCHERNVQKLLSILPSCSYPDGEELQESCYWDSLPNPSVESHGLAKRNLMALTRAYDKQYKSPFVCVALTNLFGPRDTFDTDDAKVVGRVISKVAHAKRNGDKEVVFWGTGKPLREFMFVEDAAKAIVTASWLHNDPTQPLNIGVRQEFSIKELVDSVVMYLGYEGKVVWDTTKGDGQMRKYLVKTVDFETTPFTVALSKTIEWYLESKGWNDEIRTNTT